MSDDDLYPDPVPLLAAAVGGSRLLPVPVRHRDTCPRDHRHAVALRTDGALWCRGCDEAFYPQALIWSLITGAASV